MILKLVPCTYKLCLRKCSFSFFLPSLFIVLFLLFLLDCLNSFRNNTARARCCICCVFQIHIKRVNVLVCPFSFQTTVASKFLLLQESVRDAVDLYLSLKCPPVVLVNDTPCGFARHLDLREPTVGSQLWGDCMGCFGKPSLETEPKQVKDTLMCSLHESQHVFFLFHC